MDADFKTCTFRASLRWVWEPNCFAALRVIHFYVACNFNRSRRFCCLFLNFARCSANLAMFSEELHAFLLLFVLFFFYLSGQFPEI